MKRNSIKLDRLAKVAGLRVLGNDSANPGEIVALTVAELDAMGVGAGGGQPADATLTALAALDSAAGVLYQTGADAFAKYTASQVLDLISSTRGSVLYRGASGWSALAPGTSGHVLKSGGAGADPSWGVRDDWTYLVVTGSDFTTSSATSVAITGLSFTPDANSTYVVEGLLVVSSVGAAGVAPQPGILWPGGLSGYGAGKVHATNTTTGDTMRNNTQGTDISVNLASVPAITNGYLATLFAVFSTGASPTGTFAAALESETGGTDVAARIGSHIRYRKLIG